MDWQPAVVMLISLTGGPCRWLSRGSKVVLYRGAGCQQDALQGCIMLPRGVGRDDQGGWLLCAGRVC
jgi:hypothetical protein